MSNEVNSMQSSIKFTGDKRHYAISKRLEACAQECGAEDFSASGVFIDVSFPFGSYDDDVPEAFVSAVQSVQGATIANNSNFMDGYGHHTVMIR